MKDYPLISIALCTYNGEEFLEKQINSICCQSYSNLEIIIVDDNSSDGTWDILQTMSNNRSNIKIHKNNSNIGFIKNFEKALRLCTGDYIAMSDQDDIWNPNKIEVLMEQIKMHMLVYHDSSFINEEDKLISEKTESEIYDKFNDQSNLFFLKHNSIPGHSSMFRKELLTYALPFHHNFYHDWWLAFVAQSIGSIGFVPQVLAKHRQHAHNVTDPLTLRAQQKKSKKSFEFNLEWVKHLAEFNCPNQNEIRCIYDILSNRQRGKKGLRYWSFLLRYYEVLEGIDLSSKSTLSRLNLLRKIYFNS
ncbi:glycosyltransferase family 2 protein [Olivibacter sp. CPCC 100613]|uniref:glycosyltransferase family 2 protein n=1 Tax=Olivibacter sp. CPCC 100613 TaxID=3079931 RepID=UPI002FFCEF48